MSTPLEPAGPSRPAATVLAIAILNTIGMTILFGSEIGFVALALDWSAAGLLHLPPEIYLPLGVIPMACALVATAWIAKRTWAYETGRVVD
ncbi:hypothetical protein [Microbaculum marinisediminis]|uniref:MFS transporter n=1 Tax=Microbaculum marinisediminis TaxID=2931392 RepID=A0AAW5QRZ2_9HYPH|nr:hypothetical protein [Microbaculum sp. A6E488]MCT8970413.1 hypothetical protein [Microbaculum sp. A6E488]